MDNLNEMELIELSKSDQLDFTGGGIFTAVVGGLAVAAGTVIMNDWDNFERGLTGQPYKD